MPLPPQSDEQTIVGILVLDYHNPVETLDCVRSLLAAEPASTRVLWIENDAEAGREALMACLAEAPFPWVVVDPDRSDLPPSGTVGILPCGENLGYAGGNNVGLRFLERHEVPYAWVINNDTLLARGTSALLVEAARARPEVGAWGTALRTDQMPLYFGGVIQARDFSIKHAHSPKVLEEDPLAFVSGCSLFMATDVARRMGNLPEIFFLYYEDPTFSMLLKEAGYQISGLESVELIHLGSLSTGWRSPLMEFYSRRNRWYFIERFFPERLAEQRRRFWYHAQKYFFRARFGSLRVEWMAYRDFLARRQGRTERLFSRRKTNRRREG
jgi:hypothetical protein